MDKRRMEERLGTADDLRAPNGMSYETAMTVALAWADRKRAELEDIAEGQASPQATVGDAIEAYVIARKDRDLRAGSITESRLNAHVVGDTAFAGTKLAKLNASTITEWRERLPRGLKPSSVDRLLNDVRAALNAAVERSRRRLPAHLPGEIKIGTRRLGGQRKARKQVLTDDQVRGAIEAAYRVNEDFGALVLLAAATGARYGQLAALRVDDLLSDRVMVPGAKKGRLGQARPPVAVPLQPDAIKRLKSLVDYRQPDEPLLMRWAYRRGANGTRWVRSHRRPLGPAYEVDKPWTQAVETAALPEGTLMYALRHSSIVRGLKAGLPVRMVAQLHDTSSPMIEGHYARYIVDAASELGRRAALSLQDRQA